MKRCSTRPVGRAPRGRAWAPILWLALAGSIHLVGAQAPVDAAFERFWAARNPAEAAAAAEAVAKSGASFAQMVARLKQGRAYSAQAPRGIVRLSHRTAAGEFVYTLDVPETYDPGRSYQVRVHGGIRCIPPRSSSPMCAIFNAAASPSPTSRSLAAGTTPRGGPR